MKTISEQSCALCGLKAQGSAYSEGELRFCCPGCRAVYRILEAQKSLSGYEEHPIFREAVKSGLISNPELLETMRERSREMDSFETRRLHLDIQNMWCPSCAEVIRLILMQQKGVKNCVVDYCTDLASIEWVPRFISEDRILAIIEGLGYGPRRLCDDQGKSAHSLLLLRFIVAAFCALNVMMFSYPVYASYFFADSSGLADTFSRLSFAASIPALTYCGYPVYRRFWQGMKAGILGMEALISISVFSAIGLSVYELAKGSNHIYFDTATVIITFVLLGKIIESKAKFSAKESLMRLTRALPRRGRKKGVGFVPLKEIRAGDILVAHAGEKIVLDGIVVEGEGGADESLMTGEVVPVQKLKGESLIGGSLLKRGSVSYRVTKTLEESTLSELISLIETELKDKVPYSRAADRVAKWLVPAVLSIAVSLLFFAPLRALSVLVIACPCALGIAVPLVESRLMHRLSACGAVVRNRGALSLLGKETAYVFDKTGTVTEGKFRVLSGLDEIPARDRAVLKSMCLQSAHPASVAISTAIAEKPAPLDSFEDVQGNGLKASYQNEDYCLGSASFLGEKVPECRDGGVITTVFFSKGGRTLAALSLGDQIKTGMKELVQSLPATYLLSGDGQNTVSKVAGLCGFKGFLAEANPLSKRDFIDTLRKREVICFVGDGLNDAPAIAGADIGISVMSATDMSIQASDILLTTDNLSVLQTLRTLGKQARRLISQNLFWAFGYNVIGIGLAVFGLLSPIYAAFAMVLSSVIVILNAQRI